MTPDRLSQWLEALGYAAEPGALHRSADAVRAVHPYAQELRTLLRDDGDVRAHAVYDVEGMPTVVFLVDEVDRPLSPEALAAVRQRLWNQNLASVVLAITDNRATAFPVPRSGALARATETLRLDQATPHGRFSAAEVRSSDLARRLEPWFNPKARVDRKLLLNLKLAVEQLGKAGLEVREAQLLLGQVLFMAYLEHRGIVSDRYRTERNVGSLHALVRAGSAQGMLRLIAALRRDFNGDFLEDDTTRRDPWASLSPKAFDILDRFLSRVDMDTGEQDFWNYDFSYLPVELLSGLYESFLGEGEQAATGAYYTPRHLATLAVDEALRDVPHPVQASVFDGACGSGILLTTTFRRLLSLAEAEHGSQLGFKARCELLSRQIFGGDINEMACRVTAFSLYLALLEGLEPADVLALQDQEDVKLPRLRDRNLFGGPAADIFGVDHPLAGRRFSLCVSNPPWSELPGNTRHAADAYADTAGVPFVRRQTAGLYAFRVLDFLAEGGRLCLILPIPLFVGPTSGPFVPSLFTRVRPQRLINFGDLQGLLFPTGENSCHVFVATRRESRRIPIAETFDYWVPKADLSLAYGRLTLLSADRHHVQTQAVFDDPTWLVSLMWGNLADAALLARLSLRGALGAQHRGRGAAWKVRKGVHVEDASRPAMSSKPLRAMPHVDISRLREGLPVLHGRDLVSWPAENTTVVGLTDKLLATFDGPRIVFPDGFSREELEVRTAYIEGPASITSSVGAICAPAADAPLLRFLALYLRSSLAKYFLLLRCWKLLADRNALHLNDLDELPFHGPAHAANPARAQRVLEQVSQAMTELRALGREARAARYAALRPKIDEWVFDYFDLAAEERTLVREAVAVLLPSVRPRSFSSLDTVAQKRARPEQLRHYAAALARELDAWRDASGGTGRFDVAVVAMPPSQFGPLGAVRIALHPNEGGASSSSVQIEEAAVAATLALLREQALVPQESEDLLQIAPDTHVWVGNTLYLIRPLAQRGWLERTALQDAARIVEDVQRTARPATPRVAA